MKKNVFLLGLLIVPMLAGCSNGGGTTSTSGESKPVTVRFFVDFNQQEEKYSFTTDYGVTFDLPEQAKLSDADAPDPAFPYFLGYSYKPVINDENDLWKFGTDKTPEGEINLNLYGIWVEAK